MERDKGLLLREKYAGQETAGYWRDCKRLASGEPLAYVIGWQPFLGLNIYLDSKPLIPRPETEWWTEQMLAHIGTSDVPTPKNRPSGFAFLDLCAGSGAIGCAVLARFPHAQVHFGEVDPAHKATILRNIRSNGLDESRAHIRIGDIFEPFRGIRFDIIAANPPYIPDSRELSPSVSDYEPARALRAGRNGLAVIRRIAAGLSGHLKRGGVAYVECDSSHAAAARKLFTDQRLHARVQDDQYGRPRVVTASFP